MVRHFRDLISALVLVAAVAVSVAAAVRVARQKLPDEVAQPLDFDVWMIDRDLSQESEATRQRLARNIEQGLRDGDWAARVRKLDADQRQRVEDNFAQVLELWFLDKMHRYFAQPEHKRQEYLDREIDKLMRLVQARMPSGARSRGGFPGALVGIGMMNHQVDEWIAAADPALQPQMREFQIALQNRLIARELERASQDN